MVVRVNEVARSATAAEQLRCAVRDHLVRVHVRRRARPGLEYVEDELGVQPAVGDLPRRACDRVAHARVEELQIDVRPGRGPLDQAERADHRARDRPPADREVQHRALRRRAVVRIGRHVHRTHRVALDARRLRCHVANPPFHGAGSRISHGEARGRSGMVSAGRDPMSRLACFKAYDVRGRVPDEIDARLARDIGRAYAAFTGARRVVVGHDIRPSSPELAEAVAEGLNLAGVDVVDIGLCGTEHVYFATFHLGLGGGIMVTASHNPARLQRPEARARGVATDQRGHRAARDRAADSRRAARSVARGRWTREPGRERGLRAPRAGLRRPGQARAAAGRGQRGQRRRRACDRSARAAPAVRVREDPARARRLVPQRRAEPVAPGEPASDRGCGAGPSSPRGDRVGRRFRPVLPVR